MLSWSSHHLNQCTRICVTRTGASPLVLPRSRTHAALPETSSGGDAVRPHPVTRNENRRPRSTWVLARRTVSGSRSASDGRLGHYLRSVGPRGVIASHCGSSKVDENREPQAKTEPAVG